MITDRDIDSVVQELDEIEQEMGAAEDAAGLARSTNDLPWSVRLNRLRTANARPGGRRQKLTRLQILNS